MVENKIIIRQRGRDAIAAYKYIQGYKDRAGTKPAARILSEYTRVFWWEVRRFPTTRKGRSWNNLRPAQPGQGSAAKMELDWLRSNVLPATAGPWSSFPVVCSEMPIIPSYRSIEHSEDKSHVGRGADHLVRQGPQQGLLPSLSPFPCMGLFTLAHKGARTETTFQAGTRRPLHSPSSILQQGCGTRPPASAREMATGCSERLQMPHLPLHLRLGNCFPTCPRQLLELSPRRLLHPLPPSAPALLACLANVLLIFLGVKWSPLEENPARLCLPLQWMDSILQHDATVSAFLQVHAVKVMCCGCYCTALIIRVGPIWQMVQLKPPVRQ